MTHTWPKAVCILITTALPHLSTAAALDCLRFSNPARHPSQFIINFCKQAVFVAVIEFQPETARKHCAVYGLQGGKYAKRYAPGEYYERDSLKASYDADRAMQDCRLTGYEFTGTGLGDFIHFTNTKKRDAKKRDAKKRNPDD